MPREISLFLAAAVGPEVADHRSLSAPAASDGNQGSVGTSGRWRFGEGVGEGEVGGGGGVGGRRGGGETSDLIGGFGQMVLDTKVRGGAGRRLGGVRHLSRSVKIGYDK